MNFRFPVIVIDENFHKENLQSGETRQIVSTLEKLGHSVLVILNPLDVHTISRQQAKASALLISIDDAHINNSDTKTNQLTTNLVNELISTIRKSNAELPLFLLGDTKTSEHLPNSILSELHGFIHRQEDTPDFVAKLISRESKNYLESLTPPFFKALLNYAENGSYSWHCPGHSGGVAFLKSPVGQMFHQFFGENLLRADVCNAVEELGQLLDHTGPVLASEKNAARIFNSDHLFFVTNGTSTSNKIVWHSQITPDDIVIVDRNCHKSVLHSIMMTGAIPIFLTPTRNHLGLIGPIPQDEFKFENIQKKINESPFIKDKSKKPRILTITQSTYDGILYNVESIKKELDGKVDALHFDEAWLPHANFHPFYQDMHAIGSNRPRTKESTIYATQSTHKVLAGLSQASQILVHESENSHFSPQLFNEAYMMHTSTSPQYSIITSCDVSAAMMEAPGGTAMIEESLNESIDFRLAMEKVDKEWGHDWWFQVWGPKLEKTAKPLDRDNWFLNNSQNAWHGFKTTSEQFNILDPIKTTIVTPGLTVDGEFADSGIPATIVAKYLVEHGVIVEKYGLYSFFIMFTIGITKGRWNTLVAALQQFKSDYDKNNLVSKVMPKFARSQPHYENLGLKDLCQKIHLAYAETNMAKVTTDVYLSNITADVKPSEAFHQMARGQTYQVPIDEIEGQTTAVLLTPYPPGIPLLVPGEIFNKTIVNYLKFVRDFNLQYPGFETDIHGLTTKVVNGKKCYFVDCIKKA